MSTISAPWSLNAQLDPNEPQEMIPNYLRISVGLEDVHDIIHDFQQALQEAYAPKHQLSPD